MGRAARRAGPAQPELSADHAWAEYRAAVTAGDGDRAVAMLEAAADAGDWGALGELVQTYERGYLRTSTDSAGTDYRTLPVSASPLRARHARARYADALDRARADGDPHALYRIAGQLLQPHGPPTVVPGEMPTQVDSAARDSADALYRQIVDADLPRMSLAMLALALGDSAAYVRHIDEAVAAGESNACTFKLWFTHGQPDLATLRGRVAHYDRVLACDPGGEASDYVADDVRALHEQIALGNAGAVVALDSLRALGLFERHPRLASVR